MTKQERAARLLNSCGEHLAWEARKPNPNPELLLALCKVTQRAKKRAYPETVAFTGSVVPVEEER